MPGKRIFAAFLALVVSTMLSPVGSQASTPRDPDRPRTLVHLLDYLAADYPGAVQNGVVIDSLEFAEMVEFGVLVDSLVHELTDEGLFTAESGFTGEADALAAAIHDLADPADIALKARSLRDRIVLAAAIPMAPLSWPDISAGRTLYAVYCTSCHGDTGEGDGPAGVALDPKPAVLNTGERVASIAPFQAFNTIRLGVSGTGMTGFPQLTDKEAWDLAFFVKSIASGEAASAIEPSAVRSVISLAEVASLNDPELERLLVERGMNDAASATAAIRTASPPTDMAAALDIAIAYLAEAERAYRDGRVDEARQFAVSAYLEGVEPVEPVLGASDPALVARIEREMMGVRSAIQGGRPAEVVSAAVTGSRTVLIEARGLLETQVHSAWFTFGMALSILLREALEAFLIIIAMLGVLRASGQMQAARWIHAGWVGAVLVGLAGWFLVDALLALGAARRELLEGGIALFAVVVLLSVGFWLHDMTSARKWKAFLDERIRSELGRGSLFGLAGFAFFAVFREAFESVLFLSALGLEGGEGTGLALGSATALTLVIVLVGGILVVRYSARLPIKQLFRYASILIVVLAIVLAGKGVHALQEAGILSASMSWITWRVELLGLYPTIETLVAQLSVILTVAVMVVVARRSELKFARAAAKATS